MGALFAIIRRRVVGGRYLIGQHATERLEERGILEWQVVDGIERAELLAERLDASPHPTVELRQYLADGAQIKAVWSHMISIDVAKLVTVHFFDE
jgi:hypothetical protein